MCFSDVQSRILGRTWFEASNCVNFSKKVPIAKFIEIIRKAFIELKFQLILNEHSFSEEHRRRGLESLNYFAVLRSSFFLLSYLILFNSEAYNAMCGHKL